MTFVIGMVWGKGVLMVSDSKATLGVTAEEERKIYPIFIVNGKKEIDLAILGGSGDASIVKQSYTLIENLFKRYYEKEGKLPAGDDLDNLVDTIQGSLIQRFSFLRLNGINPEVSLILGTLSECEPRLYTFDSSGLYEPRHRDPGYAMIGIGRDTGGLTLLKLFGYNPQKIDWDMGLLTMFLIDVVSSVNPYVSPVTSYLDSLYLRCNENEPVLGPLKPESFEEYKVKVRKRIEIIRKVWDLSEKLGEDKVSKALEKLKGK
ncbi:hypothetical protein [Saccharolobus sp. E5-1-F]|uniref:hypothetical protein n=1 Tax=Saccharolobus sp. E5-1-F TaxID=2663019 RepID=UPI0015E89F36|nr:hypothetical protein [Sulfolobus sp. E5-1-F]